MCKLCWSVVALLALVIGIGAYQFIVKGSTVVSSDGRQALMLEVGERGLVLTEMRAFLVSVQQITQGVSAQDTQQIAQAARRSGTAAAHEVPASLIAKLPLEFKQLGFDTHSKFDTLALDAEQLSDPAHSLRQLSELMNNCLACHQTYRIDPLPATGQ